MLRAEAPAEVPILRDCVEAGCASAVFFRGVDPRDPHRDIAMSCELTSGTLRVESRTAERIRGTFSGRGTCVRDPRVDPFVPFAVEAGTFDVAVSSAFRPGLDL